MLFNSFEYLLFLPLVFFIYWMRMPNKLLWQNSVIVLSSYLFYGWWDWRFLFLIAANTTVDFLITRKMSGIPDRKKRKPWMLFSLFFNLGILCFFKYFNFFVDSWIAVFAELGYTMTPFTTNIILPIGISFYTFQTIAYVMDVYKDKIKPTDSLLTYAAFISFFPQLLAGPIERASNMMPQMTTERNYRHKQVMQGLRLILWGLFKKIVIADTLALVVAPIFQVWYAKTGTTVLMGGLFFTFQMYADFSGYSDIAIGSAKMMGVELSTNFRFPMFSRNMVEYWQRWHISLSTWFKDYVYIPMGGSRKGIIRASFNILFVFFLSGLWHGANWPFVVWAVFHVIFYWPEFIYRKIKKRPMIGHIHNRLLKYIVHGGQILFMWYILSLARLFYRSPDIQQGALMLKKSIVMAFTPVQHGEYLWYILAMVVLDYFIRRDERNPMPMKNRWLRYSYCSCLIIAILFHLDNDAAQFLYFQF